MPVGQEAVQLLVVQAVAAKKRQAQIALDKVYEHTSPQRRLGPSPPNLISTAKMKDGNLLSLRS